MLTRNGVCYDLQMSPYRLEIDGLIYVFSSKNHLLKFKYKRIEHSETINESLSRRFNVDVYVQQLSDVVLYSKIETRGFLILTKAGEALCKKEIKFDGGKMMKRNLND